MWGIRTSRYGGNTPRLFSAFATTSRIADASSAIVLFEHCQSVSVRVLQLGSPCHQSIREWELTFGSGRYRHKTPSSCNALRTATTSGSSIASTAIVTRPICVRAFNSGPSQTKWSAQLSRRWKRRTISLVSGSSPATFGPLNRVHWIQARARFSSSVLPPCCLAMM